MNIQLAKNVWRKGLMMLVNIALLVGLGWSAMPVTTVSAASTGYVQDVDAGGAHTCMLTAEGGVKCWGFNGNGQVGDNTSGTDRYVPVDVTGLTSGVAVVVTGRNHSCALLDTGGVQCWGANSEGQLGNNTTTPSSVPVDVCANSSCSASLNNIVAIAAGEYHTCAVLDSGGVRCWGDNTSGQLGNNSTTDSSTPVNVGGLTNASAVTAGQFHTCALTDSGGVQCWGYNVDGQLGDNGSNWQSLTPVDVCASEGCPTALGNVTAISAGLNHTCAIVNGGAQCWGKNDQGQLGDNSTTNRLIPVEVEGLTSDVGSLNAGYQHTCAVTTGGAAMCWGDNTTGQVGNTTFLLNPIPIPVNVSSLSNGVNAVIGGNTHSCALLSSGLVKCWGGNVNGQLGDGNAPTSSDMPVYQLWLKTYAAPTVSQGMCGGNGPCFTSIQQAIDMATGYPYYATVAIDVQVGTYTESVALDKYATLTITDSVTLNGNLAQYTGTIGMSTGTFSITGNWTRDAGVFNHNGGTVIFSGSGVQTISGIATWFNNLTVNSGSTLIIPAPIANRPTVDGVITNNGALRQTQTVSGYTDFLALSNKEYDAQKYWGVWITPNSGSMGDTTVTIHGNQYCTTVTTDQLVKRCFEIAPTTPTTATIAFHYTEAERNGQDNGSMLVYHWNTATHVWDQETGSYYRSGSGDQQLVNVTGVSNYSKFALGSGDTPTAVKLSALAAAGGGWAYGLPLSLGAVVALMRRKR
jgi:alpha-tubulin suppressor-like RCC1 family protein